MAETLSYNNAPETEVLTPEEQESLEVGEQLQGEQDALLAGKYKNAEELEKAYVELQKKLGSSEETPEEGTTETEEGEVEEEEEVEASPAVSLITDASTEFSEKGEITPETMAKFSEMSSSDLVKAYMEMQSDNPQTQIAADLSDAEINTIKNSVGGEKQYESLVNWASETLDKDTVEAFDSLVNSGNAKAIQLAVQGMKAQYENENGYEGRMLTGKQPKSSGDVFRSQQELVAAMSDPRYDADPAYRQDVIAKLDRSDLDF
tara:strand:- start:157 stop:942 length:786 start_codon:yes stop_codon:yes gene_type:complete